MSLDVAGKYPQPKFLGQAKPTNTTATPLYSPASGVTGIIRTIFVANSDNNSHSFTIYFDNTGSLVDTDHIIFPTVAVNGLSTVQLDVYIAMNNSAGTLSVKTNSANNFTFTAFGEELT